MKTGMRYETTSLVLGVKVHGTNIVTKCLPNRRLEFRNVSGVLHWQVAYELRQQANRVTVQCTTEVSSQSKQFAFTKPVLKLLAKRELQTDMQALKIAVEQRLV